jgi:hypothetical protein
VVDRIELHAHGTITTGESGVGAGWLATATRLEDGDQPAGFAYLAACRWTGALVRRPGLRPALLRRLVRYGQGLNRFGPISDDDLTALWAGLHAAGHDPGRDRARRGHPRRLHGP